MAAISKQIRKRNHRVWWDENAKMLDALFAETERQRLAYNDLARRIAETMEGVEHERLAA